MPVRTAITFESTEEKEKFEKLAAKAKLSLSNYIRRCLGLAPLTHGGPRSYGKKKEIEKKQRENHA